MVKKIKVVLKQLKLDLVQLFIVQRSREGNDLSKGTQKVGGRTRS